MSGLSQDEISKYWEIFQQQSPQNNLLSESQVVSLLNNSQLPGETLNQIWYLSDIDGDRQMDFEEFCIAMRLVFDHLKNPQEKIPSQLPQWLVPSNKKHLLEAKLALSGTPLTLNSNDINDDEELNLRTDFSWYISPQDRSQYESIYTVNCDRRGGISFDSLTELYKMLSNIPSTDISSAWNLVNPKSEATIDKEQCIVFLHILNQRNKSIRIPRSVPASLRATFGKEMLNYDITGPHAEIKKPSAQPQPQSASSTNNSNTMNGSSGSMAENYLSKLGITSKYEPLKPEPNRDLMNNIDDDWEEVRLKRELNDLNARLRNIEESKKIKSEVGATNSAVVRKELKAMLDYKQSLLSAPQANNLGPVKEELDIIFEQLDALKEHLVAREQHLISLNEQIKH